MDHAGTADQVGGRGPVMMSWVIAALMPFRRTLALAGAVIAALMIFTLSRERQATIRERNRVNEADRKRAEIIRRRVDGARRVRPGPIVYRD